MHSERGMTAMAGVAGRENRPPPSALDLLAVAEARLVVGVASLLWLVATDSRPTVAALPGLLFLAYGAAVWAALRWRTRSGSTAAGALRSEGSSVFDHLPGAPGSSISRLESHSQRLAAWTLVILDLLAATALVLRARDATAPFYLIYLLPVASAGLQWGPLGGYAVAVGACALDAAAHFLVAGSQALGERAVPISSLLILALLVGQLLEVWRRRRARAIRNEQARIARDLHDDFVQALVAAGLRTEFCRTVATGPPTMLEEELSRLHELINTCLRDVRRYLSRMRAAPVEELGLVACVHRVVADVFRHTIVRPSVTMKLPPWPLAPEVETAAFYIVREALFNVRKHAQASQVRVQLEYRHHRLALRIVDDGIGLPAEESALLSDRHHGLHSMRERVEGLRGTLTIRSTAGRGTQIEAEIPVKGKARCIGCAT
jgi:signal transduction histidine kinase